jgi:hypothetical protein
MISMTHIDSDAECEDCGERMTGPDSRDCAVDHGCETGHPVKLRSLMQVEPEPTGWHASSKAPTRSRRAAAPPCGQRRAAWEAGVAEPLPGRAPQAFRSRASLGGGIRPA